MPSDDKARVKRVVQSMLHAIDHGDASGLAAVWSEDSSMFFPFLNSPRLAVGKAAILARFTALFAKFKAGGAKPPYVGFTFDDVRVDILGDAALCSLSYPVKGLLARRSFVLVREQNDWHIKHVHGSNANVTDATP